MRSGIQLATRDLTPYRRDTEGEFHENDSEGFYLDRVDDRGCDHRYSGCGGAPGVPGLHRPGEDVRGDPGRKRMPHFDYRGVPDRRHAARGGFVGLREHDRWIIEVR